MKLKKWFLAIAAFAVMAVVCAVCAGAETYGNFEYSVLDDGTVGITKYIGSAEKVDIPKKINGKSVTKIDWFAFRECTRLTNVAIPNRVTSIGDCAFSGCESLKSITIPNSVTSIGDCAFSGCESLTNITIPGSVTSIGNSTFGGCTSLTVINVAAGNQNYVSVNGVLYNKGKTELICYPAEKKGNNYKILDSVTSIGSSAFSGCASLKSITIPSSVTNIGSSAFSGCASLKSITIPSSVTEIGSSAFNGCASLKSITIPSSVTKIGWYAFKGCTSLTSIAIPDSVTEMGWAVFDGCKSLTSIVIPDSLTEIGDSTFRNCERLTSITIPDGVISVGKCAFQNCKNLTSITIPDGVTSIGCHAFQDCKSLASITIPGNVMEIEWYAFKGCTSITSIAIPNGVTNIDEGTFENCTNLTSITIPNGVLSIENNAFQNCKNLTSITIPDCTASIGNSAFLNCDSLVSITIPGSVTNIGDYALGLYIDYNTFDYAKYDNFKIYCYPGTFGEKHAKNKGFDYELLEIPVPTKVTGVKLGGRAADALRIDWTKNVSANGYIIEMYKDGKWVRVGKITNNSTITFRKAGLKAFTVYKFRVKTYKMYGSKAVYSDYSNTVTARTNPTIIKDAKLGGRATDALRINWAKNTTADGYIVEMFKGNKWVRAAKITNNSTTTFRKAGLEASMVYYFRVRAYKMNGSTAFYGNYSATVAARTNPSVMKGLTVFAKTSEIIALQWDKNTSAQGYIVEMYKGGKWVRVTKITDGITNTFWKVGLAKNTTYKFRVRAYHMSGKTALYGGYGYVSGKTAAK